MECEKCKKAEGKDLILPGNYNACLCHSCLNNLVEYLQGLPEYADYLKYTQYMEVAKRHNNLTSELIDKTILLEYHLFGISKEYIHGAS